VFLKRIIVSNLDFHPPTEARRLLAVAGIAQLAHSVPVRILQVSRLDNAQFAYCVPERVLLFVFVRDVSSNR
jgi:hypothetical protein